MLYTSILLISSILLIILLSAKFKFNTFFVLILVAIGVGLLAGFDPEEVIKTLKAGFGHTLEKIGLLIILGTTLGIILDKTQATISLANYILARTGERYAMLAITMVGFVIGLPIFCDSGFVVLSGLIFSLGHRLKNAHVALTVCLATALYSVHCLVPPHPGISAAAGNLNVDLGKAMLLGTVLAIPGTIVAYFWATRQGIKFKNPISENPQTNDLSEYKNLPSPIHSFLPIIVPILLISFKSLMGLKADLFPDSVITFIKFMGEPVMALLAGVALSLLLFKGLDKKRINGMLEEAIEKAGPILAIIAAGGAFGEVIKALDLGKVFGSTLSDSQLGLLIPFVLTAVFKTAQGSSTVAIISASSIVLPLLGAIGLDSEWGKLLALMAMGAGSMTVSHANDAYFWVITRFGNLPTEVALKVYTTATLLMGVVTFLCVWGISQTLRFR